MNRKTVWLTQGALVAALYVVLTFVSQLMGLASGVIQLRLSEALTVLPVFFPAAVPGLYVGCLLGNLLTGCAPWDVVLGSFATLLGALGTRYFGKNLYLAVLFPILANTVIVPFVLQYIYHASGTLPYFMLTVGVGELLSCGVLGGLLHYALKKSKFFKR